jgi:cytochrome c oxidase cbb3-type subunit III
VRTRFAVLFVALVATAACEREQRRFTEASPASGVPQTLKMGELQPGGTPPRITIHSEYEENAWAVSEGKRYYEWFNCVGCHAHGGGGMGPPLMDSRWIYGSEPENIFATIVQGRPNGMPAFRGRIPQQQAWQIVAYVRSLAGLTPSDVRGQRDDDLFVKKPEARTPTKGPEGQPGRQP